MSFFSLYLLAFVAAGSLSFLSLPAWRAWCRRVGLVDDPGHRKIHAAPIPLAGGLAVMTGLAVPLLIGALALQLPGLQTTTGELLGYGFTHRAGQLVALFFGAVGMVGLGNLDDKFELPPLVKFGGQLLLACLVASSGIRITLFVRSLLFSYAITILWILTVTNAFNFMDNMNGLCAGLGAIGAGYFAWSAAAHGQYLVALLAALSCGALLGFLPHNFPKATAFLGDAGSHLVGYWLAILAILPHFYSPHHRNVWAVFTPLLVLAVPLGDLAWVVALRWRLGRPFYVGDNNHLSHRLVRRGLSQPSAVMLIWLLAALTGGLSLILQS